MGEGAELAEADEVVKQRISDYFQLLALNECKTVNCAGSFCQPSVATFLSEEGYYVLYGRI